MMFQEIIMIHLTESIDKMVEDWFSETKRKNYEVTRQIEYERAILNKICCIAEDLKFYTILNKKDYFSIQETIIHMYVRLNMMEYIWKDENIIYESIYDYKWSD